MTFYVGRHLLEKKAGLVKQVSLPDKSCNENSPARGFTALAYFGEFSEQKFSAPKGGALYPAKFL